VEAIECLIRPNYSSVNKTHDTGGWKESTSLDIDLSDHFAAEDFGEFLTLLMAIQCAPLARAAKTTVVSEIAESIESVCSTGLLVFLLSLACGCPSRSQPAAYHLCGSIELLVKFE
jgi:hypothetical protein